MRATELLNLEWIQCRDLPLSIYEKAGNILRASELNPNIKFNMKHIAHLESNKQRDQQANARRGSSPAGAAEPPTVFASSGPLTAEELITSLDIIHRKALQNMR